MIQSTRLFRRESGLFTSRAWGLSLVLALVGLVSARGDDAAVYTDVEFQPLSAQAKRVAETLEILGSPLAAAERGELAKALDSVGGDKAIRAIQGVFDRRVLVSIEINAESRVKAAPGPAKGKLLQNGWSVFLVKVHNLAGATAPLAVSSPNAEPVFRQSTNRAEPAVSVRPPQIVQRWADVRMYDDRPLAHSLSGLALEYRVIQIYSRDAGRREAKLAFNIGQGTQDLGFRSDVDLLFDCAPAVNVLLDVRDEKGRPTTASFIIRDKSGRGYPSPGRRLAPDFFFHPQIYRASGESVALSPGTYQVEYTRGPEYLVQKRTITIPETRSHRELFRLERWIDMAEMNWYSGDHHVHAAGCAHYESPTEGVTPADMWRHILGEDLKVGCVLSWGPCWYAQKQFFEGKLNSLSTSEYLMRYDVEVSGFPSSHAGHLCLLRLKEDDYPGTTRIEQWPSWDLPVLKWGKSQGGVVGFSHSGWGLKVAGDSLPNYTVPPFDGIGADEYIVDVAHDAVDFISTVDTPAPWELNIWYHTLNCGYRTRISGETDFPCIYGERVGLGRVYVKLDDGPLDFDQWCAGIKRGRSYVGDGRCHLIDFQVNDQELGVGESQLSLEGPGVVKVTAQAAARLDPEPSPEARAVRKRPLDEKPYWDIERARIGDARKVKLELVVNGLAVDSTEITADGAVQGVSFDLPLKKSSWVALRVYPSAHTNPIFVKVGGKPIRASRKSAQWCLDGVEQCWKKKEPAIRPSEKNDARKAYDVARAAYKKILAESDGD